MKETKDQKDPFFLFKLNKQNLVMFRNSKRLRLRLVTVFVFYFQKLVFRNIKKKKILVFFKSKTCLVS